MAKRASGFADPRTRFTRTLDLTQPQAKPEKQPEAKAKDKPHYHDHRKRLRERFLRAGSEGLQDYELLELVLFRAIPQKDVKPIAKALIERFGGFAEAISADFERLIEVKGVKEAAASELKIVQAAALKLAQGRILQRQVIGSWSQLIAYCRAAMSFATNEQFRVLFLDSKNGLIADEVQQHGTVNHTPVYPREIVKRALELGATAFILVHNHPSGDPAPSAADIRMTKEIVEAAKALHLEVHDHLVIGRGEPVSFRSLGLM